MSKIQ